MQESKADIRKAQRLYEKATKAALADSDKEKIVKMLKDAADLGHPEALYALADWMCRGIYFKPNIKRGLAMLKKAADRGSATAAFNYAVCLELGKGVEKNEDLAVKYYLISTFLGDAHAAYEVYRCYWYGLGVKRDRKLAKLLESFFTKIGQFKEFKSNTPRIYENW